MKEVWISLFSGIIGVILTIVYQYFLSPPQSFTFVYNGEKVAVTKLDYTELVEENKLLKDEIDNYKDQIDKLNKGLRNEIDKYHTQVIGLEEQLKNLKIEIDKKNSEEEINRVIQTATEYWNNFDFIQSLTLLKNSKSISTDVESLYKQYSYEYCLNLLKKVDTYIADMQYKDAIALIDNSLMIVYDNTILNQKIDEIKNSKPKNFIDSIKPYEKYGYTEKIGGDYMQMGGDKYYNGFQLGINYKTAYAIFNLNSNYKKITGIIGHIDGSGEYDNTLLVFGDGIIIDTIDIGFQNLPIEFSINVEGINQLKFERTDGLTQTGIASIMIQ